MKKIIFTVAVIAAFVFASCGGNKKGTADSTDTANVESVVTTESVDAAANGIVAQLKSAIKDPAKLQMAVGLIQSKIQEYMKNGDTSSVNKYVQIIQNAISGDTSLKDALSNTKISAEGDANESLMSAMTKVTTAATATDATAESVAAAAKETGLSAISTGEDALNSAKDAVNSTKDALNDAAGAAKDKAKGAVDAAKQKTEEAVTNKKNEVVNKVNDEATKKVNKATDEANKKIDKGLKKIGLD